MSARAHKLILHVDLALVADHPRVEREPIVRTTALLVDAHDEAIEASLRAAPRADAAAP